MFNGGQRVLVPARFMRWQVVVAVSILILCSALLSCGGSKSSISTPDPNIAGSWEFIATSQDGSITGIEVALQEGQVLVGEIEQPNGQISANQNQIAFVSLKSVSQNLNATSFGGSCQATAASANSLGPNSVTALAAPINFTFTENNNVFNVTGSLSGDGQSLVSGTYTAQNTNTCADAAGTITGSIVPKLSGIYAGSMCPLAVNGNTVVNDCSLSPMDSVTATLTESSGGTLTITLALQGSDNTNLTLSGPVTGNAFSVSGAFQGQPVIFYGYHEVTTSSLVSTTYMVNSTDPCLANPQTQCTAITLPLQHQ